MHTEASSDPVRRNTLVQYELMEGITFKSVPEIDGWLVFTPNFESAVGTIHQNLDKTEFVKIFPLEKDYEDHIKKVWIDFNLKRSGAT